MKRSLSFPITNGITQNRLFKEIMNTYLVSFTYDLIDGRLNITRKGKPTYTVHINGSLLYLLIENNGEPVHEVQDFQLYLKELVNKSF